MLQTIPQTLQCPAWHVYPVVFFIAPRHNPEPNEQDKNEFYERLAMAAFSQALQDAGSLSTTPENVLARDDARAWLLAEGATWAQLMGKHITQRDIERLAANGWAIGRINRKSGD